MKTKVLFQVSLQDEQKANNKVFTVYSECYSCAKQQKLKKNDTRIV